MDFRIPTTADGGPVLNGAQADGELVVVCRRPKVRHRRLFARLAGGVAEEANPLDTFRELALELVEKVGDVVIDEETIEDVDLWILFAVSERLAESFEEVTARASGEPETPSAT